MCKIFKRKYKREGIKNKKEYLKKDLSNDLQWLLRAAAQWHVEDKLKRNVGGFEVQVFAMDSVFVHARALFEFLTKSSKRNNQYSCKDYDVKRLKSKIYKTWEGPLHFSIMHMQDRSSTKELKSFDGKSSKALNKMPVDFAKEIVRLWREFSEKLRTEAGDDELCSIANKTLREAIKNANAVIDSELNKPTVQKINWS